jgi:hypothetical protein
VTTISLTKTMTIQLLLGKVQRRLTIFATDCGFCCISGDVGRAYGSTSTSRLPSFPPSLKWMGSVATAPSLLPDATFGRALLLSASPRFSGDDMLMRVSAAPPFVVHMGSVDVYIGSSNSTSSYRVAFV